MQPLSASDMLAATPPSGYPDFLPNGPPYHDGDVLAVTSAAH